MRNLLAVFLFGLGCTFTSSLYGQALKKEYIDPKNGYTEVVTYTHGSIKTIYISGQIGEGETLDAQIRSAMTNLELRLKSAGASLADLVKINTYIVGYKESDLDVFRKAREDIFGDIDRPASTLVGVQALALDKWKVEIDAVAVIDLD